MELDEQLAQSKKLNKELYCELINDAKQKLYKVAFMHVKNEPDALEIVNEAVYKGYLSMNKLKNLQFFNTWIIRILINCCLDHIKRNKRFITLDESIVENYDEDYKREELLDLYEAVDKLKEKYKSVIILKYFEDLTINQISDIFECPPNTIKTYLHKALKDLRCSLKGEDFNE